MAYKQSISPYCKNSTSDCAVIYSSTIAHPQLASTASSSTSTDSYKQASKAKNSTLSPKTHNARWSHGSVARSQFDNAVIPYRPLSAIAERTTYAELEGAIVNVFRVSDWQDTNGKSKKMPDWRWYDVTSVADNWIKNGFQSFQSFQKIFWLPSCYVVSEWEQKC